MNDLTPSEKIAALKAQSEAITAQIKALKAEDRKMRNDAVAIAQTLAPANQNILAAQKDYEEKGFFVDILIDEKTGLIVKWKLKNRRPKIKMVGGVVIKTAKLPQFTPRDLDVIISTLPEEFSVKDIRDALLKSNLGERKLQPGLGQILSGAFGKKVIDKVPGTDKGGTRYHRAK